MNNSKKSYSFYIKEADMNGPSAWKPLQFQDNTEMVHHLQKKGRRPLKVFKTESDTKVLVSKKGIVEKVFKQSVWF